MSVNLWYEERGGGKGEALGQKEPEGMWRDISNSYKWGFSDFSSLSVHILPYFHTGRATENKYNLELKANVVGNNMAGFLSFF